MKEWKQFIVPMNIIWIVIDVKN